MKQDRAMDVGSCLLHGFPYSIDSYVQVAPTPWRARGAHRYTQEAAMSSTAVPSQTAANDAGVVTRK